MNDQEAVATEAKPTNPPRVFISYTHESPEHKRWVLSLAYDLTRNGVDVVLDQWDLVHGADLTLFMEKGIASSDRVLLVCTPTYARKANEGQGGVGYERLVVTGELAAHIQTTKFVCVLRAGNVESSIPRFLKTRLFVPFLDDAEYQVRLEELLRDLHKAPANPRPPLGSNPFAVSTGAVVTALVPVPVDITPSDDIEQVYARAESLLRSHDLAGWNRFVRTIRHRIAPAVLVWRKQVESEGLTDATWWSSLDRAVDLLGPAVVLALSAVESQIPEVQQQRGLLDDLLAIEGWNRGGLTVLVEAPSALALAYHHILGAFFVQEGRSTAALGLMSSLVPRRTSGPVARLWEIDELIAFTNSLGHSSVIAWDWICKIRSRHSWLAHFFADDAAFRRAVAGYHLCGSLLELAAVVKKDVQLDEYAAQVPPLFLTKDIDEFGALVARTFPTHQEVELVATLGGVTVEQLRRKWPEWVRYLFQHREKFGHRWSTYWRGQEVSPLP